jgi:hypothetical protein
MIHEIGVLGLETQPLTRSAKAREAKKEFSDRR